MERNRFRQQDEYRRRPERERDYSEFIDEYDRYQPPPQSSEERGRYRREAQAPDDYVDYRSRSRGDSREPRPSNYSYGGHGRRRDRGDEYRDERDHRLNRRENSDNKDFLFNRDYEQGTEMDYRDYEPHRERHPDERAYGQSDWTPRDSYEAERIRNGYRHSYEARHPELDRHYDRHFDYRYGSDDIDFDSREERPLRRPRRNPRHRSGY